MIYAPKYHAFLILNEFIFQIIPFSHTLEKQKNTHWRNRIAHFIDFLADIPSQITSFFFFFLIIY